METRTSPDWTSGKRDRVLFWRRSAKKPHLEVLQNKQKETKATPCISSTQGVSPWHATARVFQTLRMMRSCKKIEINNTVFFVSAQPKLAAHSSSAVRGLISWARTGRMQPSVIGWQFDWRLPCAENRSPFFQCMPDGKPCRYAGFRFLDNSRRSKEAR